jgi:hypothetical protein
MFDSDQIGALPRGAIAATYSDLIHDQKSYQQLRGEFPHGLVLIDRGLGDPTGHASIIDVENGTHGAGDVPGWYDRKKAAGVGDLTVYANRSTMPAVDAAVGDGRHPWHWYATLDGTMHIEALPAGKRPALIQFATAAMLGFHADASVIWQPEWNASPAGHARQVLAQAIADLRQVARILGP